MYPILLSRPISGLGSHCWVHFSLGIGPFGCINHQLCSCISSQPLNLYAYLDLSLMPSSFPTLQRKCEKGEMRFNLQFIVTVIVLKLATTATHLADGHDDPPTPSPWPEQFHALLYLSLSDGTNQFNDLWYDWPRGRNVNFIQKQLGELIYDVEWNNGTSFYYTLGSDPTCDIVEFGVGIPRPDFLDDATYVGTVNTDGFLCNVWEKVEFIRYYEDVVTRRPVRWDFIDEEFITITNQVMTYEVGAVLPDSVTQAPAYCFSQQEKSFEGGKWQLQRMF